MLLALEEGYDRRSWWQLGEQRAERNGQEIQPLFTMKDSWDVCNCEVGKANTSHQILEPYGQVDAWGEPLVECVFCPIWVPAYRQDWREGRELTDHQSKRWALYHEADDAHHLFNGRKEEIDGATLPASDGIDISQWITGSVSVDLTAYQRDRIEALDSRNAVLSGFFDRAPGPITITYRRLDDAFGTPGCGQLIARRGSAYVRMAVSEQLMEDPIARDHAVRRVCEELNDRFGDSG